ncbi:MAG: transposase [Candidatus Omnitrophota bacterium]|jgi:putative transposase
MPREARRLLENVCYHILSRGNQKQRTFFKEDDYLMYLELLGKYKVKFKFKLYGFCLMPNHVHLMVEPRIPKDISKAIGGLNLCYTQWFNREYNKVGHLWQDRFKSFIVAKDQYLINCINYIELNPIRAEIIHDPMEYKWSSYRSRLTGDKRKLLDKLNIF